MRDHVLAARTLTSLAEADRAFTEWVPIRRAQVHRTHGQVIGERAAADHAALRPLPSAGYVVSVAHLRTVGKDALISFAGSFYSVPARRVRPGQRVAVRAETATITISATTEDGGQLLARHEAADQRGSWIIDQRHWDGLPDGHTRATTTGGDHAPSLPTRAGEELAGLLAAHAGDVHVAARPLADYEAAMN
ncbi:MAG: Mu transposase domain-containing protein [Nocardioidaceae bacterium]